MPDTENLLPDVSIHSEIKSNKNNKIQKTIQIIWGVATGVTVILLAVAFYFHYQDTSAPKNPTENDTEISGGVPNSEEQAADIAEENSEIQIQGMTAPADDGEENSASSVAASQAGVEK